MPLMMMQLHLSTPRSMVSPPKRMVPTKMNRSMPLYGSMVGRIHDIKPGCGSCGHRR